MSMNERWCHHFLNLAYQHALMSKDPSTKVGAVIVNDDKLILSAGFNGFPRGLKDSEERLNDRETKLKLIVHAEMNAVLAAAKNGTSINGSTMFICATNKDNKIWGGPACVRCLVESVQAGVKTFVSHKFKDVPSRWEDDLRLSRNLMEELNVNFIEIPND